MKRIVVTEKLLAEKYRLIDRVERIEEEIYSRLSFQERKELLRLQKKVLEQLQEMKKDKEAV